MKTSLLHQRRRASRRGGFTLIEMVIVLTIIGLLVAMVIFNVGGVLGIAKEQAVTANLLSFKSALATYELESGNLPTTEQGVSVLWIKPSTEPVPQRWHAIFEKELLDPWGHPYQYENPGKHNPDRYDLYSMGADGMPNTADDIGNWQTSSSSTTSN